MRIERKGLVARSLVILAAILAMAAVVSRMAHRTAPGRPYAQAIERGAAVPIAADEDAEDQNLADDEAAAGEMWAKQNRPASADDCPRYSPAFRRGCADFVANR